MNDEPKDNALPFTNKGWFTEVAGEAGSAFSLEIRRKLHEEQTPYQKIEVWETAHWGNLMAIDGYVMLSTRDNFLYHEMMAHVPLFSHADPKRVLIIGGGDCGTLREVLRHDTVEKAWQVDIDEGVTRASEKFFPELCESNADPRAELHFADGIRWVKEGAPGSVDVIIVDSTDPVGPAEGLFTEAFYRDCHAMLADGGVLVQQSESPLLHMRILKEMHTAMRAAGYADVKSYQFPQPVYPSGWWSGTMARKGTAFGGFRDAVNFETRYYTAGIHRGALAMPAFFDREIAETVR
ncbi:MAG TPA: polyamine aminopropyltransferase [Gammaproteobacteria bacterium]